MIITADTVSRALLRGVVGPKVGDCIDLHVGSRDLDGWDLQLRHERVAVKPLDELQLRNMKACAVLLLRVRNWRCSRTTGAQQGQQEQRPHQSSLAPATR